MALLGDVRSFRNGRLEFGEAAAATAACRDQGDNASPERPSLEQLVSSQAFLVISVGNCPQCEELAAFLRARDVPLEVYVKWDKGANEYPALKEALATHAGDVFSFPQVFADGVYQGGFKEVMEKADAGAFDDLFEREFGLEPATLQRWAERKPMVVFSLPNCPQCDKLREDLQRRGVPTQDVFIKLDKAQPEYAAFKAQLQKLTGREKFSFPQTFVQAVYQGDYDEVISKAERGEYAAVFSEAYGIEPAAAAEVAAQNEPPPAGAISFDDDF